MSARRIDALVLLTLACCGCVPTLSAPRSEAHLDRMAEASRHHIHGRDEEAARSFHEAAEAADRRVDRDEALYREAQTLRRAGHPDEALTIFTEVAEREPPSRRSARALFEAARLRRDAGEHDRAAAMLRDLCTRFPGAGPAGRALRLLVLDTHGPDEVLSLVASFAAITEPDFRDDLAVLEAEALIARAGPHDRDAARAALERIVTERRYPLALRWDDAFMRLADLAEEDGDRRAAIAYLTRMIAPHSEGLVPGSYTQARMPEAALRIARLLRELADAEAEAAYQRVVTEFPDSLLVDDARLELAELVLARDHAAGCARLREVAAVDVGSAAHRARERVASDCP